MPLPARAYSSGLLRTAGRGCRAWLAGALRLVGARRCVRVNGHSKRSVGWAGLVIRKPSRVRPGLNFF